MRRTKEQAEETRKAILLAAEMVFFQRGVQSSTLDDIATAAGLTRGAINWHFKGKSDLLLEIFRCTPMPQQDLVEVSTAPSPLAQFRFMRDTTCDWIASIEHSQQTQRLLSIMARLEPEPEFGPVIEAQIALDNTYRKSNFDMLSDLADINLLQKPWTPMTGSNAVIWTVQGVSSAWLLYGKSFNMGREASDSIRTLYNSFVLDA